VTHYCVRLEIDNPKYPYKTIYELYIESELNPKELARKIWYLSSENEVPWIPCEFKWATPLDVEADKTLSPDFVEKCEYHDMYHWEEDSYHDDERYVFTVSEIKGFRKI